MTTNDAPSPGQFPVRRGHLNELSGVAWHQLARLRQDVFVVEQECAYPDLDGRDLEPGTVQLWVEETPDQPLATLRILEEDGGEARRIGRVATRADQRGRGLAAQLLHEAIAACRGLRIELEAQAHLQAWYERFGFVRVGAQFLEDGIPHVPMRREATAR